MNPLQDALALLRQTWPSAHVTSGFRDPNSALGRANPRSYHNHGQAFDIRPMQGVPFNDYVAKLKAAGLPVVEALDEQANPKPWTTGPNWHVAFGEQKKMPVSPALDPMQRAKMFNIDLPPEQGGNQAPFDLQAALQNIKLPGAGGLDQALADNAAMPAPKKKDGSILWKILGVLGDGYTGNGRYAQSIMDQRKMDDEKDQASAKLKATIAAQFQLAQMKAGLPPAQTQTDRYVEEVLNPNTPPARKALLRNILVHPLAVPVYGQDGSQQMQYYDPSQAGGSDDDQWEYSN